MNTSRYRFSLAEGDGTMSTADKGKAMVDDQ
jgi:hypothetical protein